MASLNKFRRLTIRLAGAPPPATRRGQHRPVPPDEIAGNAITQHAGRSLSETLNELMSCGRW